MRLSSRFEELSNRQRLAARAAGSLLAVTLALTSCGTTTTERLELPPLETVTKVDLSRYTGTWYEIASFPTRFQRGCTGTTATYTIGDKGEIAVVNRCSKGSLDATVSTAKGRARVVDQSTNAKLQVSFFGPIWGDYWIIDVGEDYDYAVVGHPGRDYLWVLSRTPTMQDAVYAGILDRLREQRYQVDRLQKTLQPETAPATTAPAEGS